MIDNIYIFTKIDSEICKDLIPETIDYNGYTFFLKKNNQGYGSYYMRIDEFGLKHLINERGEYQIKNSIHKAHSLKFKKFGNHTDFHFTEMVNILEFLCDKYGLNPSETYIRKLEIGVNIIVDYNPMDYINKLTAFQFKKAPVEMKTYQNKDYGKKIFTSQYQLKLYDKGIQMYASERKTIKNKIIRFEAVIKKQKLNSLEVYTIDDLLNGDKFNVLVDFLHEVLFEINFQDKYDLTCLDSRALELYFAGSNTRYWKHISKCNHVTSSRKRKKYKEIVLKLEKNKSISNPLILDLRKKLIKKINQLSLEYTACNIA